MPLIKHGRLAEDRWSQVADDAPLPNGAPAIVGLERWRAERDSLTARNAPLGIRLKSDQPASLIAEDLAHFGVVALEFPKFTDGRAYSSARLLRERYGYTGEVRAVGAVLRDQFLFMERCGFDSLEVAGDKAAAAWREAVAEISVAYQPAADGRRPALALRHVTPPVTPHVTPLGAKPARPKPRPEAEAEPARANRPAERAAEPAYALSRAATWAY